MKPAIRLYSIVLIIVGLTYGYPLWCQTKEFSHDCCCGAPVEMNFPGFDFEFAPDPPPGGFIVYAAGSTFGPWTVTRATIDHVHATHGRLSNGNPNGPSNFVDLHGSPGFGEISYPLTGLTPGNRYIVEFWYAQNGSGWSSNATLRIAGGAWLNESWTVSTSGAVQWFKATYSFVARGAEASMDFGSTGQNNYAGTLIDDIKIFECPADKEKPEVLNAPGDEVYFCQKEVPPFQNLLFTDNCDANPSQVKSESRIDLDPCHFQLTRTWTATDACGNSTRIYQLINVEDREGPLFSKSPKQKTVHCPTNVSVEFNQWLNKNGDAQATDLCGKVTWRQSYDRAPKGKCDSVLVEFIAADHCGNETFEVAYFIVADTSKPQIVTPAISKQYSCISNPLDSLRRWLGANGYAQAADACDSVRWSHNFSGDSTRRPLSVTFYARDACGNVDSTTASFEYRLHSDTTRITHYQCQPPNKAFDTLRYAQHACDSIVIVQHLQYSPDSVFILSHTCDSLRSPFDTLVLKNSMQCDSIIFTQYIFHQTPITFISLKDCAILQYSRDTVRLPGQHCDSLVIIEKLPLRSDSISVQSSTCDSSKVGVEILYLKNILGCDSVVAIHTEYSPQKITALQIKECGLSTPYYDTLVFKTQLCDSLLIILHVPAKGDSALIQTATCNPAQAGVHRFVFKNQDGCDSIVTYVVSLLPSDSTVVEKSTCRISEQGVSKSVFTNRFGCDSIVWSVTRFLPSDTTYFQTSTCDPGQVKNDTLVFQTNDCDSVVFRDVSFKAADSIYFKSTTCNKDLSRQDTVRLTNRNGCDSLIFRHIEYRQIRLNFTLQPILCHQQGNGAFKLLNQEDFTQPIQFYVNGSATDTAALHRLGPGTYSLYVLDRSGCVSDSVQFSLIDPPALQLDLGSDLEVFENSRVRIDASGNFKWQHIEWSPIQCPQCPYIEFLAKTNQKIIAKAIDEKGCSVADSIFISVRKRTELHLPNVFSPNGDNINDRIYPQSDSELSIHSMQIYDRWGEKVFERSNFTSNNPHLGWDGTFQGQKALPGVYVFILYWTGANGQKNMLKGNFTLVK